MSKYFCSVNLSTTSTGNNQHKSHLRYTAFNNTEVSLDIMSDKGAHYHRNRRATNRTSRSKLSHLLAQGWHEPAWSHGITNSIPRGGSTKCTSHLSSTRRLRRSLCCASLKCIALPTLSAETLIKWLLGTNRGHYRAARVTHILSCLLQNPPANVESVIC